MQEGIHQRNDGHYEMPLPLKNDNIELPNNKELALSRLMKLKQRLKSDTQYRKDYVDFMQENIKNGIAEKVPKEEVSDKISTSGTFLITEYTIIRNQGK